MSLISLRGLGVVWPRPLFAELDLAIAAGDRIGLVAGNGAGKTTLLRCIMGDLDPGTGEITRKRGLRLGFVAQDVPAKLLDLPMAEAIRRGLPPAEREGEAWRVGLTLDLLDTPAAMATRGFRRSAPGRPGMMRSWA
jgi:ATPase subunit of ABC transporter with duplicated ATPase domains